MKYSIFSYFSENIRAYVRERIVILCYYTQVHPEENNYKNLIFPAVIVMIYDRYEHVHSVDGEKCSFVEIVVD